MSSRPLAALQVVGIRYYGDRSAADETNCLDGYAASGIYGAAGVPFDVIEPAFPEDQRTDDPATNIGILGGVIADAVAVARRAGKVVLMTGGNCTHITGVLGGLQDAQHSCCVDPAARIGLVWFDAHGDYNTPRTTLTGSLGGMPVAVAAGLALPQWREASHMADPLPTDRIILVDVRNLDAPERALVEATETVIAAPAPGFPGADLSETVAALAARVDMIYLHIDADILDAAYVPNHWTVEANGPDMAQVLQAIDVVMATGKVVAFAVVSVPAMGAGGATSVSSGSELLRGGLTSWQTYGTTGFGDE